MIYELDGRKPQVPEDGRYWVAPSAAAIGRVRLNSDCSVWFGAVRRDLGTCVWGGLDGRDVDQRRL